MKLTKKQYKKIKRRLKDLEDHVAANNVTYRGGFGGPSNTLDLRGEQVGS